MSGPTLALFTRMSGPKSASFTRMSGPKAALENDFYGCGPAVALQDAGFSRGGQEGGLPCGEDGGLPQGDIATTQLNPKLGRPYFPKKTTPQTTNRNSPSLFLSSYSTKLDQIQYATLFQPN